MYFFRNFFLIPIAVVILTSCATSKYHTSEEYIPLYEGKVTEGYNLIKTWKDYSVEERSDTLIYSHYEVESRQLFHRVFLKKNNLEKHGKETEWYGNGHKRFEGMNEDGERQGRWNFYFYETGTVKEYGRYGNGKKEGIWTFLDTLGNITATFSYFNDELNGIFELYTEDGHLYKEGLYERGKLTSVKKIVEIDFHPQEIIETESKLISCEDAEKQARIQCRKDNFNIAARIIANYPEFEEDRKVTGTALVYVEIDKQGKLTEFEILRSLSPYFEQEILKLQEIDFVFEPAISEGKPYKSTKILSLAYFPPEGTFYYNPFMHNPQFFMPPPPTFTPPSF